MHNQDTTPPDASGDARPHQPHREYEVGYGKPPKETQFKKGQSRNPKSRPGHVNTRGKLLSEVLDAKVSVIEDGRRRKIPNIEAMCKQVVNRAAQGDKKSTQAVLRMIKTLYRDGAKTRFKERFSHEESGCSSDPSKRRWPLAERSRTETAFGQNSKRLGDRTAAEAKSRQRQIRRQRLEAEKRVVSAPCAGASALSA